MIAWRYTSNFADNLEKIKYGKLVEIPFPYAATDTHSFVAEMRESKTTVRSLVDILLISLAWVVRASFQAILQPLNLNHQYWKGCLELTGPWGEAWSWELPVWATSAWEHSECCESCPAIVQFVSMWKLTGEEKNTLLTRMSPFLSTKECAGLPWIVVEGWWDSWWIGACVVDSSD